MAYLPDTLTLFLKTLITAKGADKKMSSIGHALAQATRPKSILAPLQMGLAVQLHHYHMSRFVIDTLHELGFCSPYPESLKYDRSAAVHAGINLPPITQDHFVQFVADNADYNTRTLDGNNTFHGMGIIASITPAVSLQNVVPRVNVTAKDIAQVGRIHIHTKSFTNDMKPLVYKDWTDIDIEDDTAMLDALWKISYPLHTPRPAWSGYMQMVSQGVHPGKSSIHFLPMIDLSPSDLNCVYSTLYFVCSQAKEQHFTPVLTFDQPLWWKAMTVVEQEPMDSFIKSVVLRLGGLHLEMSFLGSIGQIMAGSGLEDILNLIYAENVVPHILSGKAISRALRAHFIIDAALNALLVSDTYEYPLPHLQAAVDGDNAGEQDTDTNISESPDHSDMKKASKLYAQLVTGTCSVDEICESETLKSIIQKLNDNKTSLTDSRTCRLWIDQYMNMVDILRMFIKAERIGNWRLHLKAVSCMLPYFAAAGHNLYTKSAYLYLQMMYELEHVHPDVHNKFMQGLHVIRRSDRYWAGLSSDLVIEQVLMRSLKTSGGVTRGRGIGETQRLVWLLSMPARAEMHHAMMEFTGIQHTPSEQHKEVGMSRQIRDAKDTETVVSFLQDHNPLTANDKSLRSIASGVTVSSKCNVDHAKEVGTNIIKSMSGKTTQSITYKRKDQAVNMKQDNCTKQNEEIVDINPQLLFQRLIALRDKVDNTEEIFKYELSSFPASLFESSLLPREATKPELANAMWNIVGKWHTPPPIDDAVQYVLDGGSLLQRIPWSRGQTYDDVLNFYANYALKYGKPIVVFDGYDSGPTTKDATHQRRQAGGVGPLINFTTNMVITTKKDVFLSNDSNKQRFLHLLGLKLESVGCDVYHANADADVLIVMKAVESARSDTTIVVGEDTDLLILLCFYGELDSKPLYFIPEPKKNARRTEHKLWNIQETKESLGEDVCVNILFIHAILGCDTTSHMYGIGKGKALKKFQSSVEFRQAAATFHTRDANKADIIAAGEKALLCLLNAKEEDLDKTRYRRFCQKVATCTSAVEAKSLPPTSTAWKYHSMRVYLQIEEWKGRQHDPCEWGWKLVQEKLKMIMTDMEAAPRVLLEIIKCNCKQGCKSARCSCKKHGLECSPACGECKGVSCENAQQADLSDDVLDNE